ncbi:MAG: VWA domain-containing protein [Roseiflexaceae bacterium]
MRLSFVFPAALLLLLLLIPLWALALALPRRLEPWRFWASLGLRSALITALVLALAGTQLVRESTRQTTVFLIDSSDSISPSSRGQAEAFVQDALRVMPADDQAALVLFGENALVERTPSEERLLGRMIVAPQPARTDIERAIQLGLGLLPSDARKRLVLLSDGGENTGAALEAARLAAARGIPIDYVDLGRPALTNDETLITRFSAPALVRQGQQFDLTVEVESTVAQPANLDVFVDDRLVGSYPLELAAGRTQRSLQVAAEGQGFLRYRAQITPRNDGRSQNNRSETLVRVAGPPRVLLVEGQRGEALTLQNALRAAQISATTITPQAMPTDLAELSSYDAVVLVNVAARLLPVKAMASLPAYVRELGRGLVMIGGDRSYGVGGYGRTPVEEALPVYTDVRDREERPDLALMFVIDKSGSMDACHCAGPNGTTARLQGGGTPKVDIAKDAVARAAAVLRERDTVGVVAFDSAARWVLEPQRGPSNDTVRQALSPLLPEGSTNVGLGLAAAQEALAKTDARIKHVILLTDGWSSGGSQLGLVNSMRQEGITLSVVAAGSGSADVLHQLADAGGGRYYPVANMEDVPEIFVQETIAAVGNYLIEQPFTPRYAQPSAVLDGLENGLPTLYGYNGTTLKESATAALLGVDDEPVLAQWQYGLGRSVAWTSDAYGKWARDWVRWEQFPRFAAQLVGWVLPAQVGLGLDAAVRNEGGQTILEARLSAPDGSAQNDLAVQAVIIGSGGTSFQTQLAQVAPGEYRASIPSPIQGTYLVQLTGTRDGTMQAQGTVGMVVPYSAEYRLGQSNPQLLEQIARVSGGVQMADAAGVFGGDLPPVSSAQEIGLPLILLALLLLPADIALRRLMLRRPRASA